MIISDIGPVGVGEDIFYLLTLTPPTNIGGRSLVFTMWRNFNSQQPVLQMSISSGQLNGSSTSGIMITNSGAGMFQISIPGSYTSGDGHNYAYQVEFTDYPQTKLVRGFVIAQ